MLFKSLNDFHGAFDCWDSTYKWNRPEPDNSDSIKNEWKKGVFLQKDLLQDNIGYLRVPYMSFSQRIELDKKAQSLNDSLCALLDKKVKGIILDLRLNGGGAMFPMMLGLEQLLHEGKIGSFETKKPEDWIIHNNSFYLDSNILTTIIPKCRIGNQEIPVAVLIGGATGSSGEFLAIAFKKRRNTVFIGTNTAGYITSTKGFKITDAVSLLLATGYGRDREGNIYDHALSPDIYMEEPDSFNDIKNDKKVLAAIKWLRSRK
jgi:carboxyl-terminal processing protease